MPAECDRPFSQAVEDYLKAIYKLQHEHENVSTSEIAKRLHTSPAAASKMFRHMAAERLVEHTPYYGVRLTEMGEKIALEVIRHHRLIELYLHRQLGYAWDQVDREAEVLEHHISEEFEARLAQMLGDPEYDPHGDPIPSRDGVMPVRRGTPLAESEPGETLVILRVSDRDPAMLRYLESVGMVLGVEVEVLEKQPFNGPLTLTLGGSVHTIGRELAGSVFVVRVASGDS